MVVCDDDVICATTLTDCCVVGNSSTLSLLRVEAVSFHFTLHNIDGLYCLLQFGWLYTTYLYILYIYLVQYESWTNMSYEFVLALNNNRSGVREIKISYITKKKSTKFRRPPKINRVNPSAKKKTIGFNPLILRLKFQIYR